MGFGDWLSGAWDKVKGAAKKVGEWVGGAASKVGEIASNVMKSPVGAILSNVPILGSALKMAGNLGNIKGIVEDIGKGDFGGALSKGINIGSTMLPGGVGGALGRGLGQVASKYLGYAGV